MPVIRSTCLRRSLVVVLALLALPATAAPTVYRMELGTISGLGAGGAMSSVMGMLSGGGVSSINRNLDLRLTSPTTLPADYQAVHTVPDAMRIGPQLPLKGEQWAGDDTAPGEFEGRILIYWGCSATVAKGQPEIVDLRAMADKLPPDIQEMLRQGKGQGNSGRLVQQAIRTIHWPGGDQSYRGIPENASAVGQHVVKTNFMAQEIRFELTPALDFLEPMGLKAGATELKAAVPLSWSALSRARGYDLTAMGSGDDKDTVIWLADRHKRPMLPASQHDCVIPAGIFATREVAIVNGLAHGPTQGFSFPPQKPGENKPLIWSATVRVQSMDNVMLGAQAAAAAEVRESATESAADAIIPGAGEVLKGMKGLFGR